MQGVPIDPWLGAKISHALRPKQKQYCNKLKTFKMVHIPCPQKILKKKKKKKWDFPGKPAVKNSPFNAVGAGLIPDGEAKIPHTLGPNIKEQKQYCN